jgi:hypothetical protein
MSYQGYFAGTSYGAPPAPAPVCSDKGTPPLTPWVEFDSRRKTDCRTVAGVKNPELVIMKARSRARDMLEFTIDMLKQARAAACRGAGAGWPVIGDAAGVWLKHIGVCADDIRAWTDPSVRKLPNDPLTVAEVIRRLSNIRNLIAGEGLEYRCSAPTGCGPTTWAFVTLTIRIADGACIDSPVSPINLCRSFWIADIKNQMDPDPEKDRKIKQWMQEEFQAQTIIHEAAHLYYCIRGDPPRSTSGGTECVAQFVAATNGAPLDERFTKFCVESKSCKAVPLASAAVHGFAGLDGPVRSVTVGISFNPNNAVVPKNRRTPLR